MRVFFPTCQVRVVRLFIRAVALARVSFRGEVIYNQTLGRLFFNMGTPLVAFPGEIGSLKSGVFSCISMGTDLMEVELLGTSSTVFLDGDFGMPRFAAYGLMVLETHPLILGRSAQTCVVPIGETNNFNHRVVELCAGTGGIGIGCSHVKGQVICSLNGREVLHGGPSCPDLVITRTDWTLSFGGSSFLVPWPPDTLRGLAPSFLLSCHSHLAFAFANPLARHWCTCLAWILWGEPTITGWRWHLLSRTTVSTMGVQLGWVLRHIRIWTPAASLQGSCTTHWTHLGTTHSTCGQSLASWGSYLEKRLCLWGAFVVVQTASYAAELQACCPCQLSIPQCRTLSIVGLDGHSKGLGLSRWFSLMVGSGFSCCAGSTWPAAYDTTTWRCRRDDLWRLSPAVPAVWGMDYPAAVGFGQTKVWPILSSIVSKPSWSCAWSTWPSLEFPCLPLTLPHVRFMWTLCLGLLSIPVGISGVKLWLWSHKMTMCSDFNNCRWTWNLEIASNNASHSLPSQTPTKHSVTSKKPRWQKMSSVYEATRNRIPGFVQAYMPQLSFDAPSFDLHSWKCTLSKFPKNAARGVQVLKSLPEAAGRQLMDVFQASIDSSVDWPSQLLYGKVIDFAKISGAHLASHYRPVVVVIFGVLYRAWSRHCARPLLRQLSNLVPSDAMGFLIFFHHGRVPKFGFRSRHSLGLLSAAYQFEWLQLWHWEMFQQHWPGTFDVPCQAHWFSRRSGDTMAAVFGLVYKSVCGDELIQWILDQYPWCTRGLRHVCHWDGAHWLGLP